MQNMSKKVCYMRNISNSNYLVKYPSKEYATAFIPKNGGPFHNAVVGITYPTPDYSIERQIGSPITVFEYVLEGEGKLFIDGKWQTARAGDIYILRSGEYHHYRSNPQSPWKKIWVNYISDYLTAMLDAYRIKTGIYCSDAARDHFEQLLKLSQTETPDQDACYAIAQHIHAILHAIVSEREARQSDKYRILEALNAAVYEKTNLDRLADELHVSKSNMIRIFKKNYGVTPYEYLISQKILAAKLLLKDTKMTVKEISQRVCITDEHYFSSLFFERVGVRPKEYRQTHIEKLAP